MGLIEQQRAEMATYAGEPRNWVTVDRQGIHWDDFAGLVGRGNGSEADKMEFFSRLPHGQRFESKQELKDTYLAWYKAKR